MLYEEYAKRIRRYARIRDNILRFKIPIICVLAAALAAVSAFLITKGIVTQQISGEGDYVYGDKLSFQAKALFSDVTYEYFDGEEWSADEPFMPGEYQVRAVTERSFGRKGYSDSFSFVIAQRSATLSVSDSSVQWKDEVGVKALGLAKGDTLSSAEARLSIEGVGDAVASVDCESAVILNKAGDDVTAAYSLTAEESDITVTPRRITVRVNDVTREYDGTPIATNGYEVTSGSVWGDHSLNVSLSIDPLVNVGQTDITVTGYSVLDGGEDVTGNYDVTLKNGSASVTPRRLTISSDGASKKYDGYALEVPDYRLSAAVPECDELVVSVYDTPIVKPTSVMHITGYTLRGKDGGDVSANYVVTVNSGMLTVTKREITVITASATKKYDGTALTTGEAYEIGGDGLAETDAFTVISARSIISAGTIRNTLEYTLENDECYIIEESFGYLTISKRKITVITPSPDSKEYDGSALSTGGAYEISGDGLVNSGDFTVTGWQSATDAGSHENWITYTVNKNYDVDVDFGTIVITPRKITLRSIGGNWYYNGSEQYNYSEPEIIAGSLVSGHYITVISGSSIKNVVRNPDGSIGGVDNVLEITIQNAKMSNYDITWEYGTLTVLPLKLEILVGNIDREYDGRALYSLNRRFVNGSVQSNASQLSKNVLCIYSVSDGNGAYLTSMIGSLSVALSARHSGNVTDAEPFTVVYGVSYDNEDITLNYDVTLTYVGGECGYITITPYVIEVTLKDKTVVYNGQSVVIDKNDYELNRSFLSMHTGTVGIDGIFINANGAGEKYTVTVDVGAYTDNYEFIISGTDGEYSTLTIQKRPFKYSTWGGEWEYDGNWFYYDILTCEEYGLDVGFVYGHNYEPIADTVPKIRDVLYKNGEVSGIDNDFKFKIYDASGNDVTENYDLQLIEYGTLLVYPRAITVTSGSASKVYDNTGLTAERADATKEGTSNALVSGHTIRVYTFETMTNVLRDPNNKSLILSKENKITFEIGYWTEVDGKTVWVDMTANYCVGDKGYGGSTEYGTLTVYPRPFTITTASDSWTYDRQAHSNGNYTVSELEEYAGILTMHSLNLDSFLLKAQRTSVGSVANGITFNDGYSRYVKLIFDELGNDVSENYELTVVSGKLVVNPIEITVTPKYVGVEYDNKEHYATSYRSSGNILDGDSGILYVRLSGSGLTAGEHESYVSVAVIMDEYGVGVFVDGVMTYHVFIDSSKPMYVEIGENDYLKITADGTVTETATGGDGNYRKYIVRDGEHSTQCSYKIIAKTGQIKIRQRRITITCDSKTESYREGKTLSSSGCRITSGTPAYGHTVIGVASGRATQQGVKVENTVQLSDIMIRDSSGMDITAEVISNYDIEIISGWLLME